MTNDLKDNLELKLTIGPFGNEWYIISSHDSSGVPVRKSEGIYEITVTAVNVSGESYPSDAILITVSSSEDEDTLEEEDDGSNVGIIIGIIAIVAVSAVYMIISKKNTQKMWE